MLDKLFQHRKYLINLSSTFASQAATALAIIVLTPVLVANLGEEKFNIYGVLLNLIMFSMAFDFSLNTTLVRRLILYPNRSSESVNTVFNFFLLILLVSLPIYYLVFLFQWVHVQGNQCIMALLIGMVVVQNILAVMFESVMQSVNHWKDAKLIRVGRTLLETGLLYWVSRYGKVEYLLFVSAGTNFIYLITLYFFAQKHVPFQLQIGKLKASLLFVQLKDSFWYFQNAFASVLIFNFQVILMSHLLTAAEMTIYLLVFRFYEVIRTGLTNFAALLFPSITLQQKEGNWKQLLQYYQKTILRLGLLVVATMSLVLLVGDDVFVFWSGSRSAAALSLFFVYGIYVTVLIIDNATVVFLSALKFNRNSAIVSNIEAVILLILTYFLIQRYGLIGSAYASLLAFMLTSFWYDPFYLWRRLRKLA